MSLLSFFYSKRSSLIGLDIQSDEVYLLHVTRVKGKSCIENIAMTTLPFGTIEEGKIIKTDHLISAIKTLVSETQTQGCAAAIALPSHCVIHKTIPFPQEMHADECELDLHANLEKYLPGLTEEVCFDFLIQKVDAITQNMLLFAAKNDVVSGYLQSVTQAGLVVKIVDVDWCAISRAISLYETTEDKAVAILEVNEDSARVIFLHNNNMVFTQQIHVDKKTPDFLRQLLQHVTQSCQVCFAAFRPMDIKKLYIIGRSSVLVDIHEFFSKHFHTAVEIPNLLASLQMSTRMDVSQFVRVSVHSLVSIGLAIRSRSVW
jgi:Tfp pilus assembly PilM family ATPase